MQYCINRFEDPLPPPTPTRPLFCTFPYFIPLLYSSCSTFHVLPHCRTALPLRTLPLSFPLCCSAPWSVLILVPPPPHPHNPHLSPFPFLLSFTCVPFLTTVRPAPYSWQPTYDQSPRCRDANTEYRIGFPPYPHFIWTLHPILTITVHLAAQRTL